MAKSSNATLEVYNILYLFEGVTSGCGEGVKVEEKLQVTLCPFDFYLCENHFPVRRKIVCLFDSV